MHRKVEGRQVGRPVLVNLLMKKSTPDDTGGKLYSLVTEK